MRIARSSAPLICWDPRRPLFEAGEPLLRRAQETGVERPDVSVAE